MPDWRAGLRGLGRGVLDLVYPASCCGCGEPVEGGEALCSPCRAEVPDLESPFCQSCGEMFDGAIESEFACSNCRGQKFHFDFARPGVPRSEAAMELIRDLKYSRRLHLAGEVARLAGRAFRDERLGVVLEEAWPLVPVPLHRRRLRWRQFNQAAEIARPLGKSWGLPVLGALKRIRPTVTQTRLSRHQRQVNLKGAFSVVGEVDKLPGVVLVDDVFTTGSTVNECSRVLLRAGVQKVVVVTAMRG